jgi:hypothetical protein
MSQRDRWSSVQNQFKGDFMRRCSVILAVAGVGAALSGGSVAAQDKAAYEHRSIERYVALFHSLDGNRDAAVSLSEAEGSVDFLPVFDDIDIDRDGVVTRSELDRFLAHRYRASQP